MLETEERTLDGHLLVVNGDPMLSAEVGSVERIEDVWIVREVGEFRRVPLSYGGLNAKATLLELCDRKGKILAIRSLPESLATTVAGVRETGCGPGLTFHDAGRGTRRLMMSDPAAMPDASEARGFLYTDSQWEMCASQTFKQLQEARDKIQSLSGQLEEAKAAVAFEHDGHRYTWRTVVGRIVKHLMTARGRSRALWAAVQEITEHGSGVSKAIASDLGYDPETLTEPPTEELGTCQLCASLENEIVRLNDVVESVRQEARVHASEAETQSGIVREIYQVCSGAKGEPGDWNGAEPVRRLAAELEEARLVLHWTEDNVRTIVVRDVALAGGAHGKAVEIAWADGRGSKHTTSALANVGGSGLRNAVRDAMALQRTEYEEREGS